MPKKKKVKTHYTDTELKKFQALLHQKMADAKKELDHLQSQILESGKDAAETKFMSMDDGAGTLEKEYLNQMASRQIQYIKHLENALIRIENKTYGKCRVTGDLISKERLMAVPHTTLSIEAKLNQKKK